jgi:hypothetical protein
MDKGWNVFLAADLGGMFKNDTRDSRCFILCGTNLAVAYHVQSIMLLTLSETSPLVEWIIAAPSRRLECFRLHFSKFPASE